MSGVILLWVGDELVAVQGTHGAETIRFLLRRYLSPRSRRRPSHFGWEICSAPLARETELLRELPAVPRWNRSPRPDGPSPRGTQEKRHR